MKINYLGGCKNTERHWFTTKDLGEIRRVCTGAFRILVTHPYVEPEWANLADENAEIQQTTDLQLDF